MVYQQTTEPRKYVGSGEDAYTPEQLEEEYAKLQSN